jgi:hypothetical protein
VDQTQEPPGRAAPGVGDLLLACDGNGHRIKPSAAKRQVCLLPYEGVPPPEYEINVLIKQAGTPRGKASFRTNRAGLDAITRLIRGVAA